MKTDREALNINLARLLFIMFFVAFAAAFFQIGRMSAPPTPIPSPFQFHATPDTIVLKDIAGVTMWCHFPEETP